MFRTLGFSLGLLLLAVGFGPGPSLAFNSPFGEDFELTPDDLRVLGDSVNELLMNDDAMEGAENSWKAEKSGASGITRVRKTFETKGWPCKLIQMSVKLSAAGDPKTIHITYCEVEEGTWKSYP